MKKKIVFAIVALLVLSGIVIGGYFAIDSLFPKADPINVPSASSVVSMTVKKNEDRKAEELREIASADIDSILSHLSKAEPTRKMSVQDSPDAQTYYEIAVKTDERTHYFYVYFESGDCYVEIPYEGIYTVDKGLVNLLPTGDYRNDEDVIVINTESDIDAEQIKAHYDNGGIIVVRDWQLVDDVEGFVKEVVSTSYTAEDLAVVFYKTKSGSTGSGCIQGNTSDLEGEIDCMVERAKERQ